MKKMYNITLKEANDYIENRLAFRASNLFAVAYEDGIYSIFSYATCIYKEGEDGKEVIINRLDEYFSRSTSRHQAIIKRAMNIN